MFGIYLLIGILSGSLAGLLGIGGGIIIVPALLAVFNRYHTVPANVAIHIAIGTSLASIIFTLSSALSLHIIHHTVKWKMVRTLLPTLIIGAVLGTYIAKYLPSSLLRSLYSVFLFFVAYRLSFARVEASSSQRPSCILIIAIGLCTGILSSLLGIGGAILLIPFLLHWGINLREVTGTSVACTLGASIAATVSFMLLTPHLITPIPFSMGYIYWPALIGITLTSTLCAPIGATLARQLPIPVLKHLFSVFLILVAIYMLLG